MSGGGLAGLWRRLGLAPRRARLECEIDEELRFHLEMSAQAAREVGVSEDSALRAARLRLGNPDRLREETRAAVGFPHAEALWRDLALAARRLRRAPGFTLAATLTLALGIGANAALFALVDAVLLRPLPYPEPERIVSIWETEDGDRGTLAPANVADYRVPAFDALSPWASRDMDLSGAGPAEALSGEAVGADFFGVLGSGPTLGRAFLPEDLREGGERVVILADTLWRSRFAGDPGVLGRSIRLDREPHRVVGVLPPGFVTPGGLGSARPVSFLVPLVFPAALLANRGDHEVKAVARLRRGAAEDDARVQLAAVSRRLAAEFPATNRTVRAEAARLDADVTRHVRGSLLLMLAAVGALLAIACLNVANLQFVRALGRQRELAISAALGAARGRLVAGLLVESLLLAGLGGVAGAALARVLVAALKALAPATTPRLAEAALDARVLGVGLLATLATGVLFGLLPAWHASRVRPAALLRTGERHLASRAVLRWRSALLTTEVALALVLLVGAALLVRSVARIQAVDVGFETRHVIAAQVKLPDSLYPDAGQRLRVFEELERRLSALPGIEAVAFANRLPLRGGWSTGVETEATAAQGRAQFQDTDAQAVSPGYFKTLGIALLRGRGIEAGDREGAPYAAVVNEEFARRFFPGGEVLGRRFRRGPGTPWITAVGVVASLRREGSSGERNPEIYLPAAQTGLYPVRLADVAVRGTGDEASLAATVRAEVAGLDPEQPISRVMSLEAALARDLEPRRFGLALLSGFAALALLLTLVGIYGVAAYSVAQRAPELGIRLALGAERGGILRLVMGDVLRSVVVGIAIGLGLALLAAQALRGLLFEVGPRDPGALAGAALLLALAGLLAAWFPARRAARIDPVAALRSE